MLGKIGAGIAALAIVSFANPAQAQERLPHAPQIAADRQVTFTLKAPDARKVLLHGDWPGGLKSTLLPMTKDNKGVWSITAGPVRADKWNYWFEVDGVRVLDHQNLHTDDANSSTLLVPGDNSYNYEIHDVPHGTVAAIWYPAKLLGLPAKRAFVYTPPGYEQGQKHYPVLYLTANYEDIWTGTAREQNILDNLIAEGKAVPMIVVMPSTVPDAAASPQIIDEPLPSTIGRPSRFSAQLNPHGLMQTLPPYFDGGTSVARDLVPFIDRTYRTIPDRDHRAIVGLSASGAVAFYTAMTNVQSFAWTGGFSTGWPSLPGAWESVPLPKDADTRFQPPKADPGQPDLRQNVDIAALARMLPDMNAKANFHLVALYVGLNDPLDEAHQRVIKLLDERGVHYQGFEVPGQIHNWRFWMWCLNDYAPRLFRSTQS